MSLEIARIARKAKRLRLVLTLKSIRKPFALWPLIVALLKPVKAMVGFSKAGDAKWDPMKRPVPAYTLLLLLLVGGISGAYASSWVIHAQNASSSNPPDFSVAFSPTSVTLNPGSVSTLTIRLSSFYGFAGSVNLNATTTVSSNVTVAANPNSVSLLTGTANATLTVLAPNSTPTGTFTLSVTGTSGKLSHSTKAFLLVTPPPPTDFAITTNSTSMTLSQGSSETSSITLQSISGFTGAVNLTSTVSPNVGSGPAASLIPTRVSLTSGGTANTLLTVSTSGLTPRRGYTILVLATSGAFSHSLSISLTVQ